MLLILLTWVYMFFVFSIQGEAVNRLFFKGKLLSLGGTVLSGMIFQAICVTVFAFFYRINIEYFCLNALLTIGCVFYIRNTWIEHLKAVRNWDRSCMILFILIVLLSLARSSLLPFIIDNESYYIQTIKWLNEYGWVKGLANLHVFLSHGNPWHALQSAYNFSFISEIFNDINGFLVCVVSLLWIDKVNDSRSRGDFQTDRWMFFLPVFTILWFQFVDAPSADLPLFLLTQVVIYRVLNPTEGGRLPAIYLSVFLVFIKLSIAPILLLALFLVDRKNWKPALFFAFLLGIIYIVKGLWLSGCPLAPYTGFSISLPWTIPDGMNVVMKEDSFNFRSIFSNGWVNIIFFFTIIPVYFMYAYLAKGKKKEYPVLLFFTIELVLILFTYAQFRFILPAFFYPATYILSKLKFSSRILSGMVCFLILLVAVPLFMRFGYERLTVNAALLRIDTFQPENIIRPSGITKYTDLTFEKKTCNNFEYYDPSDHSYFIYLTGNGPIPCVRTDYLQDMQAHTGHLPALIGKDFSEGFTNMPSNE